MAGKRAVRLKNVDDVTSLLGRVINNLLRDEISESKSAKIGYLANVLLRSLERSDLEARVKRIEEHLDGTNQPFRVVK